MSDRPAWRVGPPLTVALMLVFLLVVVIGGLLRDEDEPVAPQCRLVRPAG